MLGSRPELVAPSALYYDPGSGRLFVCDEHIHRVLIFQADHLASKFLQVMPQ
jgi:hypothetical protein